MRAVNSKRAPPDISDLYSRTSSIHRYSTHSSMSQNFYTKHSRIDLQKNAFSCIGTRVWDEIPERIKKIVKEKF